MSGGHKSSLHLNCIAPPPLFFPSLVINEVSDLMMQSSDVYKVWTCPERRFSILLLYFFLFYFFYRVCVFGCYLTLNTLSADCEFATKDGQICEKYTVLKMDCSKAFLVPLKPVVLFVK